MIFAVTEKGKNDMERYIEVSNLPNFEVTCEDGEKYILLPYEHLYDIPTADVVPREEVEKWKEINEQLHKEMSERMIEERKIEKNLAVLQIMGEILSRHTPDIDGFFTIHKTELDELKKKYTEGE